MRFADIHPDDGAAVADTWLRCTRESYATGKPVSACVQMRMKSSIGAPVWVENKLTIMGPRWYCCWHDVSAPKRAEVRSLRHNARHNASHLRI